MVCKEEICNWFRHTQSYERLDLLCKLLHLCSSHEIRFIASIVEDQARKDCGALRDSAFKANEVSELKKLSPDLFRPPDRSNLLVYLSLLSSANTACAHVLFTMLTRVESQRLECHLHSKHNPGKEPPPNIGKMDSETADDVILLYTMAAYHPAFTITQRLQLSDYLQKAQVALAEYLSKPEIQESCSGVHTSTNISNSCSNNPSTPGNKCRNQLNMCPSRNNCQPQNSAIKTAVCVKKIEYKHCHWDMCGQCHVFHIKVTLSTDEVRDIHVTYQQLYDFSDKLLALFRVDRDAEQQLPYLRSEQEGEGLVNEEHISKYIRELSELPDHILHGDYFMEFFGGGELPSNRSVGCETSDLYRSPLSDAFQDATAVVFSGQVATSNDECLDLYQCLSVPTAHATTTVVQQRISYSSVVVSPLPHHSPLPSPLPSPHISPSQHTIMIRKWLKDMRLHKYNSLSEYSWHELSQLDDQDLEKIGLTDGARRKFRKELEAQLQKMGEVISKNGVINPLRMRQDSTQSCNSMNSQSSVQTVCTPALSPTLNSSVCENHTQVHLPLNIVTRVGCSPSGTNGTNSANSLSSCSGLSDCSAVTPPSSPQSQGSIAPVCTSSHQVGLPPGNNQKPYSADNGDESEESNTPIHHEVALSPAHQGPGIPNVAEVHPFTKNTSPSECHLQNAYPVKPESTSEAGMPPSSQRIPQMLPIRVPPPGDKGMPVAMPPFGVRPRKPLNAPHVRSPRMQNSGGQFVAPLMPVPPVTAATQAVHSVCLPHNGLTEAPHGLLITKPGGTQHSQISPEITPCISNMTGDGGNKPAVNFSVLPTPPQGLIPCVPSAMGPAPGCHMVQRPTALAIPNTNCMAYNSITTPSVVTTMLDKPSPVLLPPANIPPPSISTSDINVPYQNSATCSVTFTTRTAFTPVVPSPGSNQSGNGLLSTPPSSLTPQPPGTNGGGSAATSAGLIHPTSSQTPTTVPTPVPQTPSLPHSTMSQPECGCSSCQQHASHSPQPAQHPAPLQTIPTTVPFNYHLQQQPQQSMGWPQSPMFPGSYPLPSGYVPVSSNGLVNPSISFPLFTPQVPQSPFANLPPEVLFEPHNYALFQAANQSLPHTFHAQLHYPVLPSYVTGVHLPCQNSKPKSASCYNCGNHGHMPYDCKAPTFEAISRAQFCLKLQPRTEAD